MHDPTVEMVHMLFVSFCYSLRRSVTKHHHYRQQPNGRMCVSVLTGYPRADRRRYVARLLYQLLVPVDRNAAPSAARQPRDIHVYCDGECDGTLRTEFDSVAFHSLTTTSEEEENFDRPLLRRLDNPMNDTIELSGVEFRRHRWLYATRNYRRMLDDLFLPSHPGAVAGAGAPYRSCLVLEDDLVLAPDALSYIEAAERLMRRDRTVFTGSLFADNSYPLYARDRRSFRRVDHFAGLGFVVTRRRYVDELRRTVWWRAGLRNWDEQVQKFVRRRRLVSVVPEVGRALHLRRTSNSSERPRPSPPRHPFESQLLNDEILSEYELDRLERSAYDRHIVDVVRRGRRIRYLADALFFDDDDGTLVYSDCKDDADLHRILTERSLWGVGNGGIVRGSYRGTMFFRYTVWTF